MLQAEYVVLYFHRNKIFMCIYSNAALSMILLPMVSVTHSQQWYKNIKWKIIEMNS